VSGEAILSAENSGKPLGAEPRWESSQRSPETPYSWCRGSLLPLPKNLTPDRGLRPRFSVLRASFSGLPSSLHSPVLRVLNKTLHLGTYYYAILRKIPLDPHWGLSTSYPIVVSGRDVSAECLPL